MLDGNTSCPLVAVQTTMGAGSSSAPSVPTRRTLMLSPIDTQVTQTRSPSNAAWTLNWDTASSGLTGASITNPPGSSSSLSSLTRAPSSAPAGSTQVTRKPSP